MLFNSILYVDDDPDVRSIVRATLGQVLGLQVCTTDSAERAIDLAHEVRPGLILIDVMMPGLDGPSTLKRMQASPLLTNIPIIFMTPSVPPVEVAQLLQLGAIGVIVKPFDPLTFYNELCGLWTAKGAAISRPTASGHSSQGGTEIDSLTSSFLLRARADVVSLRKLIGLARAGDRSVFEEIERVSHSLHGAGAMFGFPNVSASGGAMARVAEGLKVASTVRRLAGEPPVLLQLSELSDQLAQHVEAAWQAAPQSGAMFQGGRPIKERVVVATCAADA